MVKDLQAFSLYAKVFICLAHELKHLDRIWCVAIFFVLLWLIVSFNDVFDEFVVQRCDVFLNFRELVPESSYSAQVYLLV